MSHFPSEFSIQKIARLSLILAAIACVGFWLVRIYCAISLTVPYLLETTGCEGESLFAMWKFVHGQVVYNDPNQIPFSISLYNWGYYYFYGGITKVLLQALNLSDVWIPTIGRFISFIFTLLGGAFFFLALRDFGKDGWFSSISMSVAWSLIAVLGPLIGFWSMTVRPDIGALMFEFAGLYLVLRYLQKRNFSLIILAALFFYAGWSFKQTAVSMITGSVITLLLLRDWRAVFTLCGIWWSLVILALVIGGHTYRECILFSQSHLAFAASLGLKNAVRAEFKNAFFLPALFILIYATFKRRRVLTSAPIETALGLVVMCSFFLALITACKDGASDNYFMGGAWVTMLSVGLIIKPNGPSWIMGGLIICSWLMIICIALSPTGRTFYYDYRGSDSVHAILANKLLALPKPAFVTERYSNLPWMQHQPPYFVLGYNYEADRKAGVPCERGGWEGLVNEGYFGTVVINNNSFISPSLLQKYELVDEYEDMYCDYKFYRRKP